MALDPRPKLIALLAFLVAVSIVPEGRPIALAGLGGLLLVPLLAARLLWTRAFWARLVPVLLIAGAMSVLVLLTRTGGAPFTLRLGSSSWVFHEAGLRAAGEILGRTGLAAAALVGLSLSSSGPDLLHALAWLRIPRIFVAILGSVARTLNLTTREAARMNRARELRSLRPRWRLGLRALGGIVGSLLVRSLGRAERVHQAMLARGYDGQVPRRLPPPPVRAAQVANAVLFGGLSLAAALAAFFSPVL